MTIKIELGSNMVLDFKDAEGIKNWLQEERQRWNWLDGRIGRSIFDVVARQFRTGWEDLQMILTSGDDNKIKDKFTELFGESGKLIISTSPAGQFLRRLAENDPATANAAAYYFVARHEVPKQHKNESTQLAFQIGHLSWAVFNEGLPGLEAQLASIKLRGAHLVSELQEHSETFSSVTEQFKTESHELIEHLRKEYDSLAKGCSEGHTSFMETAKTEYDEQKRFYKTELALRAPVDYWASVAKHHRFWTKVWGVVFGVLMVGLIGGFLVWAHDISSFLTDITRDSVAIALTIAAATAVFWTLRMVSKIFLSNYHRAVDAAERETMVKTFLALRHEKNITDEQLGLVLTPLFRPGISGLVRDDSAPEYGIAALLSKELSKR
jgi:hypothetical protein